MDIVYLVDRPADVPIVAQWLFDEWGHLRPGLTRQNVVDDITAKLSRDTLPIHIVAVEAAQPIGVAVLKPHELKNLYP